MENTNYSKNHQNNILVMWEDGYFSRIVDINISRGTQFPCTECSESFPTKLSLITHSKIHLKPFCEVCHQYKETRGQLSTHMYQHHPNLIKYMFKDEVINVDGQKDLEGSRRSQYKTNKTYQSPSGNAFMSSMDSSRPYSNVSDFEIMSALPSNRLKRKFVSRSGRCVNMTMPQF